MKIREKIVFLLSIVFAVFNGYAREGHEESPHYEWIDGKDVAVNEDGIYIDTNKGMMRLNVVAYDREINRYQVLCSCLERPYLDPFEALSIPLEDVSE